MRVSVSGLPSGGDVCIKWFHMLNLYPQLNRILINLQKFRLIDKFYLTEDVTISHERTVGCDEESSTLVLKDLYVELHVLHFIYLLITIWRCACNYGSLIRVFLKELLPFFTKNFIRKYVGAKPPTF